MRRCRLPQHQYYGVSEAGVADCRRCYQELSGERGVVLLPVRRGAGQHYRRR